MINHNFEEFLCTHYWRHYYFSHLRFRQPPAEKYVCNGLLFYFKSRFSWKL